MTGAVGILTAPWMVGRGMRFGEWCGIFAINIPVAGWLARRQLRRLIQPIRRMTETADQLAEGDGDVRHLPDDAHEDLGELARAFNRVLDELRTRQAESRALSDRLATVLGAMSEGVLAVDPNLQVLFANRAAGRLLGFDAPLAAGKKLMEVARNQMLLDASTEALHQNRVVAKESKRYEIEALQGNAQTLAFRATPIPGNPPPGVVLVLLDITELRRLEFLRQEFVANVSHELKTPLTAIKAFTETLLNGAIDDQQYNRKFLTQIETEADRLHELIMDVLRLAQIESGHQPFELEKVAVLEAVVAAIARHAAAAEAKQIRLELDPSLPGCIVLADDEGLRQILDNLIDNAIKYTEAGGMVRVSGRRVERSFDVEVHDSGVGIPKESLDRIFERFYRVDRARSRELGSTGLGLAIVKHLVQSFGGSIHVRSEPGVGSVFTVRLPLAE